MSVDSVSNADEVVAKLFDGIGSRSWLYRLWVMRDENRLCGLDDNDALLALHHI